MSRSLSLSISEMKIGMKLDAQDSLSSSQLECLRWRGELFEPLEWDFFYKQKGNEGPSVGERFLVIIVLCLIIQADKVQA